MQVDVKKLDALGAIYHGTALRKLRHAPGKIMFSEGVRRAAALWKFALPARAKTFWGRDMHVYLPEDVSLFLYRYGFFEHGMCSALCTLIKPGKTFFDIGSHFGFFSLLATDLGAQVHCFEPTRSTFQVLSKNLGPLGARLNNVAMWKEAGQMDFTDCGIANSAYNSLLSPKSGRGTQAERYTVQTRTVDDYVRLNSVRPDVIKIDAEGAEYEIIEGMQETMSTCRPVISIEVGDGFDGRLSRDSIRLAMSRGYSPMEFKEGQFVPHEVRERYTYDNIFLVPA